MLTKVAAMFGAPSEPIVLRAAGLLQKIAEQDFYLKTHYAPDGRSFYQIISDVFDGVDAEPLMDGDGLEAIETEL